MLRLFSFPITAPPSINWPCLMLVLRGKVNGELWTGFCWAWNRRLFTQGQTLETPKHSKSVGWYVRPVVSGTTTHGDCPSPGMLLLNVCFCAWQNVNPDQKTYCTWFFGDVDPHTFPPMVLCINFLQLGKTSVYVGVLQVSHRIHHICKVSSNSIVEPFWNRSNILKFSNIQVFYWGWSKLDGCRLFGGGWSMHQICPHIDQCY